MDLKNMLPAWVRSIEDLSRIGSDLDEATAAYQRARLTIVVGSGASIPAGVQSGQQMTRTLMDTLVPSSGSSVPPATHPFEVLVSAVEEQLGRGTEGIEELLRNLLYPAKADPSGAYHELARLLNLTDKEVPGLAPTRRLFTTNLETYIEETVGDRAKSFTVRNLNVIDEWETAPGQMSVVHFHGLIARDGDDTAHSGTSVVTEEAMFSRSADRELMESRLTQSLVSADVVVFAGYSLSDANVRSLYFKHRTILTEQGRKRRPLFVQPYTDAQELQYTLDSRIAATRNAHVVPLASENFFRELRGRTVRASEGKRIQRLADHLGCSADDIEDQVAQVIEQYGFERSVALDHIEDSPNHVGTFLSEGK